MPRRISWKTARDLALSLGFVALIAIPGSVAAVRGFPWVALYENRTPARYPEPGTPLAKFPQEFERWFADHFAFRADLVRLSSRLRYAISVSSSPMTIVGKQGWLFFEGNYTIPIYRRTKTLSGAELAAWRSVMVQRRDWLAARGSRYLVVIHPNKESVYSEFVPDALNRLPRASMTEQLLDVLAEEGIPAVDSTGAVLAIKATGREVFLRTDTHWNGLGIFAGYRAVAERLAGWFPTIHPMGLDAFGLGHGEGRGGDLSGMLALPDVIIEPDRCDVQVTNQRTRRSSFEMKLPAVIGPHELPFVTEQPDATLPRAVVMGDSFMLGVAPFLGQHFSRMLYYGRHELTAEQIEREHPDVVIDAWVERHISIGPPPTFADVELPAGELVAPPGMDEPHEPGLPFSRPTSWTLTDLERREDDTVVASGRAPSATTTFPAFTTTEAQTIWLELTAFPLEAGAVKRQQSALYWCTEGANFEEARTLKFPIVADGITHRYRLRPSLSPRWTGDVAHLRLDLPLDLQGAVYRFGAIELVP